MNIRAASRWVVLLVLISLAAAAESDYEDYEVVKPLRPSPLLRQARGPVIGRPSPKSTVTQKTTTTTEPPPPEYEDEEGGEEVAEEELTTTTEAPKKGGVRTGVVRPFRSNADLIETLKRRRAQQHSGGGHVPSTSTTTQQPTSEKSFKGGRRSGPGNKNSAAADQTGSNSVPRSTVNGRRFNTRGSKAPETPEPEADVAEEQPQRTARLFNRNRRF